MSDVITILLIVFATYVITTIVIGMALVLRDAATLRKEASTYKSNTVRLAMINVSYTISRNPALAVLFFPCLLIFLMCS